MATGWISVISNLTRYISIACLLAASIFPDSASASYDSAKKTDTVRWSFGGRTMGPVLYSVVITDPPDSVEKTQAESTIDETLERVNQLMSTYLPDSDISRFNHSDSTAWIKVAPETARVVQRAFEIHETISRAFDIRVATAVERWNFGPNKRTFELPSQQEIAKLIELMEQGDVSVRLQPAAIKKSAPELKIDLSAIAKGYAVDAVIAALSDIGCEHMMVEVGGEVYAKGYRDGVDSPWRIGIERPANGQRKLQTKVPLHNQAMATSGDYRNYLTHQGKRYSHTIDPSTCRPVTHFLASASVIANDCMTADAIATAIMVAGAEQGHALAAKHKIQLYTIDRDSGFDGNLVVRATDDFPSLAGTARAPDDSTETPSIWPTFLAALIVFSIAITGMAVGAIFANKPVTGSCGGLSAMSGESDEDASCSVCSKPVSDCAEKQQTKPTT